MEFRSSSCDRDDLAALELLSMTKIYTISLGIEFLGAVCHVILHKNAVSVRKLQWYSCNKTSHCCVPEPSPCLLKYRFRVRRDQPHYF